jgi:protein-S-isoprenylcysteine O-methyltransferase Ste14
LRGRLVARAGLGRAGSARGIAIGIALMASGFVLAARGVADLGGAMTPLPRPRDDAELVQTGAYALVRHPVYGGLILAAFGWALLKASLVAIALQPCSPCSLP